MILELNFSHLMTFNAIRSEDCLVVYGEKKPSWNIIYRDYTQARTGGFYKIVNPFGIGIPEKVFVFNEVLDAMKFYVSRKPEFFSCAIIMVTDRLTIPYIAEYLRKGNTQPLPKLCLYHRPQQSDLYALLLELCGIDYRFEKKGLTIFYNDSKIKVGADELSKIPDLFHLGNQLRFRNKRLSEEFLNKPLII